MYSRIKRFLFVLIVILAVIGSSFQAFAATSGTHTPVEGVTVYVSGATDNSMSSGAITVTAKGSAGILGYGASSKTATITITNESNNTATLSFDWTASSVNQLTIDGTVYSGTSGSFSKVMEAKASITATIVTAKNSTTNTLKMSNFAITAAAASSNITFKHNTLGSITVDSATTPSGTTKEIQLSGAALVATPVSGAVFVGWVDGDNKIISTSASFTYQPDGDTTVTAAFASASTAAWFAVNGTYLVNDLSTATRLGETVVLAANGTLPTGNYTIPAGITLLIPYDNANTLCTTTPNVTTGSTKPTAFRTLTMADGASITVYGGLSVSGTQSATQHYNGSPIGPVGVINMKDGSSITVESGGKLYAWGYIYNQTKDSKKATVIIKSGGTIYEDFQVRDWRGGSYTLGMQDNSNRLFPFSQYYVQNVQVPMKLEAGAVETCVMSVDVSYVGVQTSAVPFIAPSGDCMFKLTDGYIIKDYQESTDRLIVDSYGDLSLSPYTITVKANAVMSVTLKTENYALPINGNLTLNIESGTVNLTQDLAMLPGAKIKIAGGAICTLSGDAKVYIYDLDVWDKFCFSGATIKPVYYAYDNTANIRTALTADASIEVNGTLDASNGYLYTTSGGAKIYSTGKGVIKVRPGTETKTYQVIQGSSYSNDACTAIPITSALLQNQDSSTVATALSAGTYTYIAATKQ